MLTFSAADLVLDRQISPPSWTLGSLSATFSLKVQLRYCVLIVELSGTSSTANDALELTVNNTDSTVSIRRSISISVSNPAMLILPLTLSQLHDNASGWVDDRQFTIDIFLPGIEVDHVDDYVGDPASKTCTCTWNSANFFSRFCQRLSDPFEVEGGSIRLRFLREISDPEFSVTLEVHSQIDHRVKATLSVQNEQSVEWRSTSTFLARVAGSATAEFKFSERQS
jgi:hypothetical protein